MENRLANSAAKMVVQMGNIIPGILNLGSQLGLASNLAGLLTAEKEALDLSHSQFLEARVMLRKKGEKLELALKTGRTFATVLRVLRKDALGPKGSREWEALGFRGSRQVPLTVDKVYVLLGTMGGYLESRPELDYSGIDITSAQAGVLKKALMDRVAAVNLAKADVQRALQARAVLLGKARRLVRKVFNDVAYALDPLDGRWVEFGFNQPGLKKTPAAPEKVKATVVEPGGIIVECPPVPLAERYRVWVRVVGVDAEMRPVASGSDPSFVLNGIALNAEVEIGMTALNRRGEGRMSEIVVLK
ncbi:MAG: fibronectin type III domain-containing protein [Verrucomicrobia bacterium]|nr:fibronectin type III domain-containing protein [Verrucomicrobiota bacterium]